MLERRTQRSQVPGQALNLALAAAARRSGAEAAVLSDADGLLVAGAGGGFDLDVLAAFAPFCGDVHERFHARLAEAARGRAIHAAPVEVRGRPFFFATIGGPLGDVAAIASAADRILAA